MKIQTKNLIAIIALMSVCVSATVSAQGYGKIKESVEVANLSVFNTDTAIDGATTLVRSIPNKNVTASMSTTGLESNTAYSLWWAVFNFPKYCMATPCGVADLISQGGDPRVRTSVFWAGGFVSDQEGHADTALQLKPGRTDRELFAPAQSTDIGLQNFHGAEIHLVLRTHGPIMSGNVAEQVSTVNGSCNPTCANVFASIHEPNW